MTTYIKIFAGLCNRFFQYSYGSYLIQQGQNVRFIVADDGNTDILDTLDLGSTRNLFYTKAESGSLKYNALKFAAKYIFRTYKIGFYQKKKYADSAKIEFKRKAEYEASAIFKKIISENSVSLHIRGGDYLIPGKADSFTGICTKEYYINAIKYIMTNEKKPVFYIFTNDKPYAMQIISQCRLGEIGVEVNFVDSEGDDGRDLFLMSHCSHNIIANSTFSWWAAYLNKSENKSVLSPEHWTNDADPKRDELILPDWIKIKK